MNSSPVELLVVGDVYVDRPRPETIVGQVEGRFEDADLRIGNLEAPVTDEGDQVPFSGPWLRSPPEAIGAITRAGFDVLSLANNHAMDYGADALVDTVERLERNGIAAVGAGRDRAAAERCVTLQRKGLDVGFLAFDATPESMPMISQARTDSPGLNLVDVSPLYPEPHVERPDVEKLRKLVESATDGVDVLVVAFHFGVGYTRTVPQQHLARRAVESGADVVVGTNAHVPQGVEVYRSTPILYGLGHFFWDSITDEYPYFKELPRETVLAELTATADGIEAVRLYPARLDEDGTPEVLQPGTEAFEEVADLLEDLSAREGTTIRRENDSLRVVA